MRLSVRGGMLLIFTGPVRAFMVMAPGMFHGLGRAFLRRVRRMSDCALRADKK